ncbi:TolC family protein [Oleiagrimonas sp. C23AA]|uniref:efflux transporter outer membrane subunit n=1 Tax=Oleiagrimonas sp. C23AA TaxID=2719047 RepID=UPI001421F63B|nr:TolC family protein [Oleiagrimonas sp. C23AA]NII09552.1 TolC family protein [Oleiagrimonas sp. C23AA]
MSRRITLLLTLATLLAGCATVGPDYHLPAQAVINRPSAQGAFVDTGDASTVQPGAPVPAAWWQLYNDARLNQLVHQALHANTTIRQARAHLRQAVAVYDQAQNQGGLGESVDATVQRAQISAESLLQQEKLPVFNIAEGGIHLDYVFDLFGKLKRATQAAQAQAQASQAALQLARITVAAEVTREYVTICHANRELAIGRHSLALQQRGVDVAERLYRAGRGVITDVERARAQRALLQAKLPPLTAQRQQAAYALAALLGDTPGQLPAGLQDCTDAPTLSRPIPLGNGMQLLARRPDVRMAERQLAAATARIGVATAALYPDVSIGASAGVNGLLKDVGEPAAHSWSIGPLIHWTFPTNAARARIHAANAGADAALAAFDETVLDALRDTQTALSRYQQALKQQAALADAVDQAKAAAAQNRQLYRGGRAPYLSSLDAERTLAQARAQAAENARQVSLDQIDLFLALGGGWQPNATRATAGATPSPAYDVSQVPR